MISIIIPLYNKQNFILGAVKSVLNQTYQEYELIIVDDGSTDNSYKAVKSLVDSRIKVYKKRNEGVSKARNFGISKSRFPYIAFLDADDYWENDYLETIILLINKYPSAGMFCTGYNLILKNNTMKDVSFGKRGSTFIIQDYCKELISGNSVCWTGATCVKKSTFDVTGYFKNGIKRGEDLDLWLRVACFYDIAYYAGAKVNYVVNTENNTMTEYYSYKESIPYWEWYGYTYKYKESLEKYTTLMILALANSAYRFKKYEDSLLLLSLCKGHFKLIQRTLLRIKLKLRYVLAARV